MTRVLIQKSKQIGVEIRAHDNNHKEIRMKINAVNKYFYAFKTIFKSKLVSIRTKLTLYNVMIIPIALYVCENWAKTKMNEKSLEIFEKKILRQIFSLERYYNTGKYERNTPRNKR